METTYTEPSWLGDDIIVWKILYSTRSGFKYTPFTMTRITPCQINGEKPFRASGSEELEYGSGILSVGGGFIHTYATIEKAIPMMKSLRFLAKDKKGRSYTPTLHRCRIKAGTRIYTDNMGSIAAKEIWFEDQVDWEDIEKIFGKT